MGVEKEEKLRQARDAGLHLRSHGGAQPGEGRIQIVAGTPCSQRSKEIQWTFL